MTARDWSAKDEGIVEDVYWYFLRSKTSTWESETHIYASIVMPGARTLHHSIPAIYTSSTTTWSNLKPGLRHPLLLLPMDIRSGNWSMLVGVRVSPDALEFKRLVEDTNIRGEQYEDIRAGVLGVWTGNISSVATYHAQTISALTTM